MKRLFLPLILVFFLAASSCSTTPEGTQAVTLALVRGGVSYAATKQLAGAKTLPQWQARHDQLQAVHDVLASVSKDGISYATLRPFLAEKLADKPEALLLADILLPYLRPVGVGALDSAYVVAATEALEATLKLPAPSF